MITRFVRWILLLSLIGIAGPLLGSACVPGTTPAQKAPPKPPPSLCEPKKCDKCSKSPCYVATGTYVNDFTDLQIPTAGMYPLTISRRYDSSRPVDGPLGIGWSSSLTAHLYYAVYYFAPPNTYSYEADVIMPNGALYRFTKADNGSVFFPPVGSYDSLLQNADGTYSLTLQHTRSVYKFSVDGSLVSLTDDYGNAINYTYDGSGRLQRVADSAGSGRYFTVTWGTDGRIASLSDNAGRIVKYIYGSDGTLIGYSDPIASPDPSVRTNTYNYVTGRFGPVLSRIEDRWHRTISNLTWLADGRLLTYTDGDYNDSNPSSSPGERFSYSYLDSQQTTTKSDSLGSTSYQWAASGIANDTRTFDLTTGLIIGDSGVGYTYNALGNIATIGKGDVVWTYTYDANYPDQVASVISSRPNQWAGWRYTYYAPSEVPAGALKTVSRIGSDGVAQVVATYFYDVKGHVASAVDANGRSTIYAYSAAGDVTSVWINSPNGPGTSYAYDAIGRVTRVTTPSGNATNYTYDDDDRITSITLPSPGNSPVLDFTTRISYDNYDSTTGLMSVVATDPNGHTNSRGYDALGHLLRSVDALGKATQYAYQYNLLHSIMDANSNVTSFDYNSSRFLIKTTFFDGAYETYSVNATGDITAVTDRKGVASSYSYDNFGRLSNVTYGSGFGAPYVSYSYAGQNLTGVTDGRNSPPVSVSYAYDSQWRLATETESAGVITYSYTTPAGDALASYRVDPPSGQTGTTVSATMNYDTLARLNRIDWSAVSGSFTFAYNADGQYTGITFPNGQSRTFTYDNQGRLMTLANLDTHTHNLITYSYSYDYDWPTQSYTSLGNRTSVAITGSPNLVPNGTNKYSYDANQQLTGVTRLDGTNVSYDYDAIGNRLHQAFLNGGTLQFTYFQNASQKNTPRLRNAGGADLTYDANGNVTSNGYSWDAANRLSAFSTTTIQYDAQNRRAVANTPAPGPGLVKYVSLGPSTIAERSANTARTNDYLFGPGIDEPLARRASDGTIQYYAIDGLGSVTALTSPAAQINRTITYDEWGTLTAGTVDLFGYTGRETTSQTGTSLWYYRARHYAANWGRFLSEDPLRDAISTHAYGYVNNNPLLFTDPLGLTPWQKYLPNPWGCQLLTAKCYQSVSCCAKKFDYNKIGEDDAATEAVTNASVADPVWNECFKKSETCAAMLMKCKSVMNPFKQPGAPGWKPIFQQLSNWITGND